MAESLIPHLYGFDNVDVLDVSRGEVRPRMCLEISDHQIICVTPVHDFRAVRASGSKKHHRAGPSSNYEVAQPSYGLYEGSGNVLDRFGLVPGQVLPPSPYGPNISRGANTSDSSSSGGRFQTGGSRRPRPVTP
jgi:hypothetical protein